MDRYLHADDVVLICLLQQSIEAETAKSSEALKKSFSAVQDRLKAVSKPN